ncbi:MAG: OmpA family protein [Sterolibacteriaceae bacterium]|nr:OmpA family protein [Candidatus Methylophosphatis haderslevensis]
MDLREVQNLEGVTIIDPTTARNRRIILATLAAAAIGVTGWFAFDRPADKAPAAARAAPVGQPAANTDGARQSAGTIAADAAKPLPAIRLAEPPPDPAGAPPASLAKAANPATLPMTTPVAPPATAPTPAPAPIAVSATTPAPAPSRIDATAPAPAPTPPVAAPQRPAAGTTAQAAAPRLKLDTEFASAKRIVPFAFNKAGVGPLGAKAVKELAPLARRADKVNVRGRTDGLGNAGSNRKVALDRARTVYNAFVQEGVHKQKLRLTYCTTCFVAANDTEAGRRLNRRVEVELIMPRDQIAKLPKPIYALEAPPALLTASRSLHDIAR